MKKEFKLKYGEIKYCNKCNKFYKGGQHEPCEHELEIVITAEENKDNDYTTLDTLLNGFYVSISCNSNNIKSYINNPQSVLCGYDKNATEKNRESKDGDCEWHFLQPDFEDDGSQCFQGYGHIKFYH